jgi:exopolysaccharide biosynthesis polyprenyl glycosylphosphotransferase
MEGGSTALMESALMHNEVTAAVDARTREILDQRRRTAKVRRRGWLIRRMLLLADVSGLLLAYFVADFVVNGVSGWGERTADLGLFVATLPAWIVASKLYGLYDRDEERNDQSTIDDLVGVFHLVTVGVWAAVAGAWVTGLADLDLVQVMLFWALAIGGVTTGRGAARAFCRRRLTYLQNTVIVGAGDVGQLVARKILQHPEYGINLVGFVDGEPRERRSFLAKLPVLGPPEHLRGIVQVLDVERVVIAFSKEANERTLQLVRSLKNLNVQVDVVPRLFEVVGPSVSIHTVEGLPLVGLPPVRLSRSSRMMKRGIDFVGAAVGLVLTAPLFAFIAWRIKRDSPGPVLFRQTRLGMNGREFTFLKFRTMKIDTGDEAHRDYIKSTMDSGADPSGNGLFKLDREEAVTRFGRFLRRTSLDELPQLVNVLRGDMSLVGPRPCIPYETEHFASHHFERFLVPAGMTGLWQVTARAHSTYGEALDMDVAYARSWSLGLDVSLLLRTPGQFFRSRETA